MGDSLCFHGRPIRNGAVGHVLFLQLLGLFPDDESGGIGPGSFYYLWGGAVGGNDAFPGMSALCGVVVEWHGGWAECLGRVGE